jgi:DNA primase
MDGDRAGVSATLKLCEKLLPKLTPWRRIHVTTIHAGEDPDSLIGKGEEGIAELRAALEQPQPIATFMFEAIRATHDVSSITGRAEFRAKIRETVMSVIDPDLAVEWEEASLEFITTSLTRKNAPHVEMLDEKVAEILIGSVLLDPVLLTKVEDIFAIMPVPQTLSGLKTDITRWWLTSELKTKEALIQYLRAGDALHAARSVALIAKAHQERSENAAQIARDPAKIWTSLFLSRTAQKNVENAPSVMRCQQGQPTITVSL